MEEMCALSMKSAEITKASGQISAVFCKFFCKSDRLLDFRRVTFQILSRYTKDHLIKTEKPVK